MIAMLAMAAMMMGADGDPIARFPGGWELFKNPKNCAVTRVYGGTTIESYTAMRLAYYPASDATQIVVFDPKLENISDNAAYTFRLRFPNGAEREVQATGINDGHLGYVITLPGKAVLPDFAANRQINIVRDGRVIETFAIDLAAAPVAAMQTCAASLQGDQPGT